ncbi:P-loop NTPase fold protein [Pantoea sp. ICBG 985]|uniref:KAP family P-loop NTPase fold protein n=1 Tax=Pantoea sp. ICBG 985 TaxID=2071683 RepID=UPI001304D924|nr:P-loop NTPase fold protein [Pantoea sp. ICBG 985]
MKPDFYFSQSGPINSVEDDRFGFGAVADGLAESLLGIKGDEGMVIGLEGRWGAGKTSLLNLLLSRLERSRPADMHVLSFSPWLSGGGSLAEALLLPVADIIRRKEELQEPAAQGLCQITYRKFRQAWRWLSRKRNEGATLDVLNYLQQTSGRLAPIADFAGNFVPGFSLASKGMDALARIDLSARTETAAKLREDIESRLKRLGLTFIIVIDDLDRLEPSQAVEVLRLVRSVADFSRFRYVMCYDRDVLAHAVERGLNVADGRVYLQKIVPITFTLPRPETFKLRGHFLSEALQVYKDVNGQNADPELVSELSHVADIYGEPLTTPREVTQAINSLRFLYPGMRDYVCFPDLCLLQLLRVVNPDLYAWVEHYLTERAIVESKDGRLSEGEQQEMSASLSRALTRFTTHAARSPWALGEWVPGIHGDQEAGAVTFAKENPRKNEAASAQRRLSSPVYWRYYFAFSAPGNVLSDAEIAEIIRLAREDRNGLRQRLLESLSANGVTSRTWFEHILTRLTPSITLMAGQHARRGLLDFLFNHADSVLDYYRSRSLSLFFRQQDLGIQIFASQLIRQMLREDRSDTLRDLNDFIKLTHAVEWAASYMRDLLWLHGAAGDRPGSEEEKLFSADEMDALRQSMTERMAKPDVRTRVLNMKGARSYLWAWRDIAGVETIRSWVNEACQEDASFLHMLLCLRTAVSSSNRGEYLRLDLAVAEKLTEQTGHFRSRLDAISDRNQHALSPLLDKVREAIDNNDDM